MHPYPVSDEELTRDELRRILAADGPDPFAGIDLEAEAREWRADADADFEFLARLDALAALRREFEAAETTPAW